MFISVKQREFAHCSWGPSFSSAVCASLSVVYSRSRSPLTGSELPPKNVFLDFMPLTCTNLSFLGGGGRELVMMIVITVINTEAKNSPFHMAGAALWKENKVLPAL